MPANTIEDFDTSAVGFLKGSHGQQIVEALRKLDNKDGYDTSHGIPKWEPLETFPAIITGYVFDEAQAPPAIKPAMYWARRCYVGAGLTLDPVKFYPVTDEPSPFYPSTNVDELLGQTSIVTLGQNVIVTAYIDHGQINRKRYLFVSAVPSGLSAKILSVNSSFGGGVGAGSYMIGVGTGSVAALDPTRNFQPPDPNITYPVTPTGVFRNVFEAGSGATGTTLLAVGTIVTCQPAPGQTNGAPPLQVYYGGAMPTGTQFEVVLVWVSGAVGDATTQAAGLYDIYLIDNSVQLAASQAPDYPRPSVGQMSKAIFGSAYLNAAGVVVLAEAYEVPIVAACVAIPTTSYSAAGPSWVGF